MGEDTTKELKKVVPIDEARPLEKIIREIRRGTRVVGALPDGKSEPKCARPLTLHSSTPAAWQTAEDAHLGEG